MKSQDVVILLKLLSIEQMKEKAFASNALLQADNAWKGWSDEEELLPPIKSFADSYSLRNLEATTGISKTEVSAVLKRLQQCRLISSDLKTNLPLINRKACKEFVVHGLKYVFPIEYGSLARGIPTKFFAPALRGHLYSSGDLIAVWPDAYGTEKGQSVIPLFKTVPKAVKQDEQLYKFLAIVDAIRGGAARESQIASKLFEELV